MKRNQERLVWMAAVILAFAVASIAGRRQAKAETEAQPQQPSKSGHFQTRAATSLSAGSVRSGAYEKKQDFDWAAAETPEEVSKLLMDALAIPSDTERFQHLIAMLDHVTPENWQALWRTYIRQTLEEGRVQGSEWSLFMNRVGELDGPRAMAFFEVSGQPEQSFNRREILEGWAAADPYGAIDWMKQQDEEGRNVVLWPSLLGSVAEADPSLAFTLMEEVPETRMTSAVSSLFKGIVQTEGLAGAKLRLEKEVSTLGESEIPPSLHQFYKELASRVGRMQWLGDEYIDMEQNIPDLEELSIKFAERRVLGPNHVIAAPKRE